MNNHSLITANGSTHAKIGLVAVAASFVLMAVVSATGVTRPDAREHGPVVKATTMTTVAGGATVR